MTTKILEQNVADLQHQLYDAYKHINELYNVKRSAQTVIDASDRLNEYAHYNTKLQGQLDCAIHELHNTIQKCYVVGKSGKSGGDG